MKRTIYNEEDGKYYDEEIQDEAPKIYYSMEEETMVWRRHHTHEWIPLSVTINSKLIQHCKCGAVRGMNIESSSPIWLEAARGGKK